ncbi:hypothetical protein BOH66_08555 [Microbacterium aurum]|uniref:Pycsar effector protein domain-containing protein n=1 Tax=Microbacterium aurum TaxID=36805 RepID=A0A1P8U886_9MICO|nr:Pycsar system effector family protein [Microbacterium aurum]APZ34285.1 hypothetical protein BOH66_08555 [Microbacterium aurum]MBM7828130.1 hypothetical protein [Microbacterium aurum]
MEPEQVELSDELAWRVHENAKGWISQVDVKSAAALAIEAAVLGFALALITNSDTLSQLTDLSRWIVGVGLFLLLVSVVLSMLVLMPRIKLREPKPKDRGYLYFGHLRHWDKEALTATLARNQVSDGQIADQVIKMSQIAWRKHVLLQWSLYFLLAGIVVIGGLYLLFVIGFFPAALGDLARTPCPTGVNPCP